MRVLLLFILSLSLTNNFCFSQKSTTIVDGPEIEAKRSLVKSVIGTVNNHVVICRSQKSDLFLELLDQNANVAQSTELNDLEYEGHKKTFVDAFILNEKLYVRFSAYAKKSETAIGIIDEYDPASLQFMRNVSVEKTVVKGVKRVYWYGVGIGRAVSELSEMGFYVSSSENFAVDYSSAFEKDGDKAETVFMRVYDNKMNEVWKKEFVIPYANELFKIINVIVDDKGNTYLLGKEYMEKPVSERKGKVNYKYHVLSFKKSGTEVKDNELKTDASFITDATIGITSDGLLVASGFYGVEGINAIDGAFSVIMDLENGQVKYTSKKPFEKDYIQLGMSDREKKKSDRKEDKGDDLEMPNFDLDRLVLMPDGGWMLMAEQFYITTRTYTTTGPNGSMQTRTVTVYNYDDIIVVRMNSMGEIMWKTKIVKHQSSSALITALSYTWFHCNETIYIVYNNIVGSSVGQVVAEVISPDGAITREAIAGGGRDELYFMPTLSERTKNCQLLLYSAKKKKYRFSMVNAG